MGGIGSFVKSAVSSVTGGLLMQPEVPKAKEARQQFLDPNRGKRIAAARKAKGQLSKGRSSLRIDLAGADDDQKQTRSGVTIG